jgi:cell division protein FtsB
MREAPPPPKPPRPFLSFLISLAASSAILAMLLLWDHRVLELKRARVEVQELDAKIAERTRENEELRLQIDAAHKHEFPAEKVAREELHLVNPEDLVLLYPPGSLSGPDGQKPAPAPPSPAKKSPKR